LGIFSGGIKIGPPVLLVRNIDEVLGFYQKRLDLQLYKKYQNDLGNFVYELGFKYLSPSAANKTPLLMLQHDPNARNASPHSAGLFHFAILLPDRESLASTYLALRDSGVQYDGFADHLVSESLYLKDPENNGIEIYRDRLFGEWPRDSAGRIIMDTLPLDLHSLLAEMKKEESKKATSFPSGGRIGRIHLKVTSLERSIKFYNEKIQLDITVNWSSMGAAFLSTGGYHHHIGMNTWDSLDGEAHREDETGLKNFTMTVPNTSYFNTIKSNILNDSTYREQMKQRTESDQFSVSDPDGIHIVIKIK
jgi:catechol 2,3-dioxygenase